MVMTGIALFPLLILSILAYLAVTGLLWWRGKSGSHACLGFPLALPDSFDIAVEIVNLV
jgi:hypothetical protein